MEKSNIKQLVEAIAAKMEDVKVETSTRNEMYIITSDGKMSNMDDMLKYMSTELVTSEEAYATVIIFRAMQTTANYPSQKIATVKELERAMDANDIYVFTKRQALYTTFEYMTFIMCLGAKSLNDTFASVNDIITAIYDNGGFIIVDRKSR